jgi:hypothetical protein
MIVFHQSVCSKHQLNKYTGQVWRYQMEIRSSKSKDIQCNDQIKLWRWSINLTFVRFLILKHINLFKLFLRHCTLSNTTTGVIREAANPSRASEFTTGFYWGSCYSICSFLCSVLVHISFFLLVITLYILWFTASNFHLISSNLSCIFIQLMLWTDRLMKYDHLVLVDVPRVILVVTNFIS